MDATSGLMAACLLVLAVAHSILGEREILRPLFAAEWSQPAPRWAMQRVMRFAWHLTSITWVGLAAAALEAPLPLVLASVGLASAAVVFATLRGHLAWPLFMVIGVAGLQQAGLLSRPLLGFAALAASLTAIGAAGWHFYWAVGGTRGAGVVIPQRKGAPLFRPAPWLTATVGVCLLAFAGLLPWVFVGAAPTWSRWLLVLALLVFVLRAIGDGRQTGFGKRDRSTPFAVWDDRLFTPLVVLLAVGTSAALLA